MRPANRDWLGTLRPARLNSLARRAAKELGIPAPYAEAFEWQRW